jgi:hypothetical protein
MSREAKKIKPFDFVLGFIFCCSKKHNTFCEWAIQIGFLSKKKVTLQGVFCRVNEEAAEFARQLLEHYLLKSTTFATHHSRALFSSFSRVLLHDSTTLSLPKYLSDIYPGSVVHGAKTAIARIQTVLNIKTMQFLDFKLTGYTKNDQAASKDILTTACAGDLVIRDMGYFATKAFEEMAAKGIFFLSRLRFGSNIYDKKGNLITMSSLTKRRRVTDKWVYIGKNKELLVRLIMLPLPKTVAAERIRKARQHPDKRFNHSKEYYECLQYSIFITTVGQEIWTAKQIAQVYQLRWQIEIVFKSWKSGFSMQTVLHERCTNEKRVRLCIYLMLLFICLFMQKVYIIINRHQFY